MWEELLAVQKHVIDEFKGYRIDSLPGKRDEELQIPLRIEDVKAREVEFNLMVRRVYDVKTIEQHFSTRLVLNMRWPVPEGENPPDQEDNDGDWIPDWTPKIRIDGMLAEGHREELYTVVTDSEGNKFVSAEIMTLVTISEQMELRTFPNDCQDLSIVLQCCAPVTSMKLVPRRDGSPLVDMQTSDNALDDFVLIHECPFTVTLFEAQNGKGLFSTLRVQVKIMRDYTYYLINVGILMCLICSFILCAWAVHPGDHDARWLVDFNLILTAVAFKLVLNGMLPKLSYLTMLDIYVLVGFFFLAVATLSHSLLPLFFHAKVAYSPLTLPPMTVEDEQALVDADMVSFFVFLAAWSLWNVGYLLYAFNGRRAERSAFVAKALANK